MGSVRSGEPMLALSTDYKKHQGKGQNMKDGIGKGVASICLPFAQNTKGTQGRVRI
jgi:hypothetical protein